MLAIYSYTEMGVGVSNSTNKLLSLTPLLSMDVIRLARKCQAANNLDVVQKDVNPFLVMKQMDRNLL